jgi:hypothetical protein
MASDHQAAGSNPAGRAKAFERGEGLTQLAAQRVREFDYRTVPIATWICLGFAALELVARFTGPDPSIPLADVPSLVLSLGPLLWAAAIFYARPADSRIRWGAALIATAEIVYVVTLFVAPERVGQNPLYDALDLVRWLPVTPAGLFLVGIWLGGLRSRYAVGAAVIGLVFYAIGEFEYLGRAQALVDAGIPLELIIRGFIGPVEIVAWAFVAGAALQRGMQWLAVGSAMIVVWSALNTIVTLLVVASPATDFGLLAAVFLLVNAAAWSALIYGALTELPRMPVPEEAPAPS